MLDRYKKKGGFNQLLLLLESSGKAKQDQLLGLIGNESKVWESNLRSRILDFESILGWEDSFLVEILTRVQPLTLAISLHGMTPDQTENHLRLLSQIQKRRMVDLIAEKNPTPVERASAQIKFISEVRALIQQGVLKLEKIDQKLVCPENFEEKLQQEELKVLYESPKSSEEEFSGDAGSAVTGDNPTGLRFHLPTKPSVGSGEAVDSVKPKSSGNGASDSSSMKDEIEFLRKKVVQLNHDISIMRQDNSIMRQKLDQIKKIA